MRTERRKVLMALHPLVVLLCIPVAFFLLEWPYNDLLFAMDAAIARLNLALVGSGLVAAWFLGQRRSGAVTAYLGVCLGFGLANYFVCLFKEQTVPAGGPARHRHGGRGRAPAIPMSCTRAPLLPSVSFSLPAALLCLMPSVRLTRKRIAFNVVAGLLCVALPVSWYHDHDIEKDYGVTGGRVRARGSPIRSSALSSAFFNVYKRLSLPCPSATAPKLQMSFRIRLRPCLGPNSPRVSCDAARRRGAFQKERTGSEELPTVIAIMNESFSDLSTYPGIEYYAGLPAFDAIDAIRARRVVHERARGRDV